MDARQPLHAILKFRRDSIFIRLAGEVGDIAHVSSHKSMCLSMSLLIIYALPLHAYLIDPINVTTNE